MGWFSKIFKSVAIAVISVLVPPLGAAIAAYSMYKGAKMFIQGIKEGNLKKAFMGGVTAYLGYTGLSRSLSAMSTGTLTKAAADTATKELASEATQTLSQKATAAVAADTAAGTGLTEATKSLVTEAGAGMTNEAARTALTEGLSTGAGVETLTDQVSSAAFNSVEPSLLGSIGDAGTKMISGFESNLAETGLGQMYQGSALQTGLVGMDNGLQDVGNYVADGVKGVSGSVFGNSAASGAASEGMSMGNKALLGMGAVQAVGAYQQAGQDKEAEQLAQANDARMLSNMNNVGPVNQRAYYTDQYRSPGQITQTQAPYAPYNRPATIG